MEPKLNLEKLIELSGPTREGNPAPFGFATRMTALLQEQRQRREMEWLGWRAFQVAFCAVALLAVVRFSVITGYATDDEAEPGTQRLLTVNDSLTPL
jgi:hypothetical protein